MRGGIALMGRVAGTGGRFVLLLLMVTGVAWGQQQNGVLSGEAPSARMFDSIRLLPDVKAEVANETQDAPGAPGQTAPAKKIAKLAVHRFWDTENILLFA